MSGADLSLFNQIGAAITVAMGALGLVFPNAAARLVGLEAVTAPGRSEFRATYGGFFVAMGLAPLLIGAPILYGLAGLCWGAASLGRSFSIVLDRAATPKNFVAVLFEAAISALLISGAPLAALSR